VREEEVSLTYDQLFPGRFIKAGEMGGKPVTMTIKDVYLDTLEGEDGREKQQAIVSFTETKRELALNKTNAQCMLAMWGPDTGAWLSKRLTIMPERDASGLSDSGLCIRVKGSPDITKAIEAQIKLPRRRPMTRRLVPTGGEPPITPDDDIIPDDADFWPAGEAAQAPPSEPDDEDIPGIGADEIDNVLPAEQAKATQRQQAKIAALLKETEADIPYVQAWMREQFGMSSRSQLSKDQAGKLIEYLSALPGTQSALDADGEA